MGSCRGADWDCQDLVDPAAIQIDDLKLPTLVVETFAERRQVAHGKKGKPGHGVVVSLRPDLEAEPIEFLLRRHHAIDQQRSILALDHPWLFAFDLGQFACDGLAQVGLTMPCSTPYSSRIVAKRTGALLNSSSTRKIGMVS